MTLQQIIQEIDSNQSKIASYGKFDEKILKKINYKLRLDWNYYSNRMEGGTLTKAETRSVMVGNIDVHGKPYKDVAEMKGHDDAVLEVLKMSKGELTLSENRIKSIHKTIMHEDQDELRVQIGEWKRANNEIINYKNEKITFADWSEVPELVHQLLDKTNSDLEKYQKGKTAQHALEIAAQFHIDFITIHPFYDGNGRTTRILTNIILLSCGLPAIIIKDEHKKIYYQLLADIQAYEGNPDLFYAFIGERVIDTQVIVIDAIEGKSIEDDEDIDKEIILIRKQLEVLPNKYDQKISPQAIKGLLRIAVFPAMEYVFEKLSNFDIDFISINYGGEIRASGNSFSIGQKDDYESFRIDAINLAIEKASADPWSLELYLRKQFQGSKKHVGAPSAMAIVHFKFDQYFLEFVGNVGREETLKLPYGKEVDFAIVKMEMNKIIREFLEIIDKMK